MSSYNSIWLPPLKHSQKQRSTTDCGLKENCNAIQSEDRQKEESTRIVSVQLHPGRKLMRLMGKKHIYTCPGKKPELLLHLESYVRKELNAIDQNEPNSHDLRLQVYQDAFGYLISEFKMYQPILSDIKKEYESALAHQQNYIRELEPLRFHLRLVTEEHDRKIQAERDEEQTVIRALKREKQQLQKDIETMREKEMAMQAVVDSLRTELSTHYLLYREERDARTLLICQLDEPMKEHADERIEEAVDPVELQLAVKVCREDLAKAHEELIRVKAEYWDVVPRRDWDNLEKTHKQTVLQLQTLQHDFDQLKSEHITLMDLFKNGTHKEYPYSYTSQTESQEPNQI